MSDVERDPVAARDSMVADDGMPAKRDIQHLASQIIRSSSEAIIASTFDGTIIYWNPAAENLYGWTADEVLGQNIMAMMSHLPFIDRTRATLDEMRSRQSWTREVSIVRKDGSQFAGEITLSQLKDEDGQSFGVVGITSDISERRHAEQRLAILYSITRLLAGTTDLQSVTAGILKVICEEIEWHWGAFWTVDDATRSLRCVATWDDGTHPIAAFSRSAYEIEFAPGQGVIGSVWSEGKPAWIFDYPSDPRAKRSQQGREVGIASAMIVPVLGATGDVIGVVEIMTHHRLQPNEPLLEMVAAAAGQLGLFIERQRASESLVEHESRLRRLEESDLIGIMRAGLDGTILSANDAFLEMTGYSHQDLDAGLRWDEMTPQDWQHVDYDIANDIIRTGRSRQREKEYIRKDGSRVAVLIGAARLDEARDEVIAFVIDISAWKQAEREREESLARESSARQAAHDAQQKAEQLLAVTAALSRARTPDDVAHVTINEGMSVLDATGCAFTLVNDAGDALQLLASVGYGPGTLDTWGLQPLSLSRGFPITECVVQAEAIWVRSHEELFQRFPVTREVTFPYSAAIAAIPLFSNGRPVGAINLGFDHERDFSEAERVFIETLVQFCSQALERAWIYEREQHARRSADFAQQRAEQLFNITAALSRAPMPDEVASVVIDQGLSALGVHGGVIALLTEDRTALNVLHSRGYPPESVERWKQPMSLDRHVPMTDAIKRNESVWVTSQEELLERYPVLGEISSLTAEAVAAIPLVVDNQVYGVLGLQYRHAEQLDQAERVFARTLARLSSQALERANLFELERSARLTAETTQQRLTLLANAGELLTSSLDTNVTLDLIARLLVPEIGDWCAIDVLGPNGMPDRVSIIHADPEKVRWAEDLQSWYPFDPSASTGLAHVLRSGTPEVIPYVSDEMITAAAQSPEQLAMIREVGFQSVMIVPMIARGRTMGAITLVHAESGRHYGQEDLALVEDLAYRAALAIDNARLFEESQNHAIRLDAIAEVSRQFAEAGHDIGAITANLAEHITRHVGDWTVVRLVSEDGVWLNPVAIHHPDDEARTALDQMFMQDPLRTNEGLTGTAASTGEALMLSSIDPEMIRRRIKPEYRSWMDRYPMYSVLIAPMRRRSQVVGTIAMFRGTPDAPYTDEDRRFAQNVADRAALAIENAQLFHQAQEAVRLREEFLSIASHEMRTPLTTITGFTHLLNRQVARGQLDPDRVEAITGSLLSEAIRLDQLVGDLLDVSRIQQGRLDIRPEPCDLTAIVYSVVGRLGETYEYGVNREIVIHADSAVEGVWDPTRIDQIVTNLVTNALKYSEDGEITITVTTELDDAAVLTVQDRGAGIPEEQQDRLFEPFVRGYDAHHRASGTGLGLYITRQIVQHHGGTIDLESEPGHGTTFTVRLPMESTGDATSH